MTAAWKPGDVAMVNDVTNSGNWQPATCIKAAVPDKSEARWLLHETGVEVWSSVSEARPLVVIDPEDAEQVERLARRVWVEGGNDFDKEPSSSQVRIRCAWQAALREFASPTPPKPDEPTLTGAVIADRDGDTWVRRHNGQWEDLKGPAGDCRPWEALVAQYSPLRVLSPGVGADA